jgi:uncharacterized small protein (DUF1192 family)
LTVCPGGSTFRPWISTTSCPKRPAIRSALLEAGSRSLSVEELNARIAVLEAEIARAKAKIAPPLTIGSSAENLFKR